VNTTKAPVILAQKSSFYANIRGVDTLWRLSTRGAGQQQKAIKTITASVSLGAFASLILLITIPPGAYSTEIKLFDVIVLLYSLGSLLSTKIAREQYPGWLMHFGILLTTATIFVGALAYPNDPISMVILTFYIWGSIEMYSLLSWKSAVIHTLIRIPLIITIPILDHLNHAAAIGPIMSIVVLATGVSAGVLAHQNRQQAMIDPLTSCPNRRALELLLEHELARQSRSGIPITVATLDLDHFKNINDGMGHEAGDKALIAVTRAWITQLRSSDIISRFGGDEFVIVLPDCNIEQAQITLNRLVHIDEYSCSIGATETAPGDNVDQILLRADRAMYKAKAQGKGQVVISHEISL